MDKTECEMCSEDRRSSAECAGTGRNLDAEMALCLMGILGRMSTVDGRHDWLRGVTTAAVAVRPG